MRPGPRDFGSKPHAPRSPSFRASVPLWRDPWAACLLVIWIAFCAKSIGGPLGEPVAEDFDFLHRALMEPGGLWNGGGSKLFWRPIAHQLYFGVLGHSILTHPVWIAVMNAALLGLTCLLVYRALRDAWPRSWAATAAGFPLLTDGGRMLVSWGSNFADLGAMFFSAACLHEVCRRRMPSALICLAVALGCKEVALIAGLLLPWIPSAGPRGTRERIRWAAAFGGVMCVWAIAYVLVRRSSGLQLPIEVGAGSGIVAVGWFERVRWALVNVMRAQFSLASLGGATEWPVIVSVCVLFAAAVSRLLTRAELRARFTRYAPIALWGAAWWTLAAVATAPVHPLWMPYRSVFAGLGLASAIAAVLGTAHPALLVGALAVKVASFLASPAPPAFVASRVEETGSFLDFERLVRLQRLMHESRTALSNRFASLPRGSTVAYFYLPKRTEYAFRGDAALQLWYGDPTLHFRPLNAAWADSNALVAAVLAFEPHDAGPTEGAWLAAGSGATRHGPQVVLIEPAVLDLYFQAGVAMGDQQWDSALGLLHRSEDGAAGSSLLTASIAGAEALCLDALDRHAEARSYAEHSVELWPACPDGLYSLASIAFHEGRYEDAEASLGLLRERSPTDTREPELREQLRLVAARTAVARRRASSAESR